MEAIGRNWKKLEEIGKGGRRVCERKENFFKGKIVEWKFIYFTKYHNIADTFGTVQYGTVRYGTVRYGTVWRGAAATPTLNTFAADLPPFDQSNKLSFPSNRF